MELKQGQVFFNHRDLYGFGNWLCYKKEENRIVFAREKDDKSGYFYTENDPINYGMFIMEYDKLKSNYTLERSE